MSDKEERAELKKVKLVSLNDLKRSENEIKQKKFLESLNDDEFYYLLSAYDLGRSIYGGKESVEEEIKRFGGKEKLFEKNIEIIKSNHQNREDATEYILGKSDSVVKLYLSEFQNKY